MRARDVVGRRIVSVRQRRSDFSAQTYEIDAIVLDNGTEIQFWAQEHPDGTDPLPVAVVVKSPCAAR